MRGNPEFGERGFQLTSRLTVAIGLLACCGCGSSEGEYKGIMQTRTSAQDGLEAQGGKFSEKRLPVIGELYVLSMSGSKSIDDKTFEMIKETGKLISELDLSGTNVTDAHLALLNDKDVSRAITKLNLSNTEITDKGLQNLTLMSMLTELNLENTKVTAEGVKAFQKARAENEAVQAKKLKIKQ
ncbi:MAG: hypothetical protein ACT4QC_05495 [Planctomycetaceae bacterium]